MIILTLIKLDDMTWRIDVIGVAVHAWLKLLLNMLRMRLVVNRYLSFWGQTAVGKTGLAMKSLNVFMANYQRRQPTNLSRDGYWDGETNC